MALAVFDTGAFLAGAFAAGFAAFAGAVTFFVVVAAFEATFFAVAILYSYFVIWRIYFCQASIVLNILILWN
jgi:hypothetical protein